MKHYTLNLLMVVIYIFVAVTLALDLFVWRPH